MPQPSMSAPLPGCVTIDAKTPDGYLDNARAGNPRAAANNSTQAAVRNWLSMLESQPQGATASLIGHGAAGYIETGSSHIGLDNQAVWAPLLQPLRGTVSSLALYGALVGSRDAGAKLLHAIAQVINAPVYAPTGIIYCRPDGGFSLEARAVWQVARPGPTAPAPINPPNRVGSVQAGQGPAGDQATGA